jgi:hypothetical protein
MARNAPAGRSWIDDSRKGAMVVFDDDTQAKIVANKRNWDARAPIHVRSKFYGIGHRDPMSWFAPFEWRDLGRLDDREVVHLQCHLGVETMAFALKGAHHWA